MRRAVARDGIAAFAASIAGRDRHVACGQRTREGEQGGLALRRVAADRNAAAAGDHEERTAAFDAVVGGEQLLEADHGCRAQ